MLAIHPTSTSGLRPHREAAAARCRGPLTASVLWDGLAEEGVEVLSVTSDGDSRFLVEVLADASGASDAERRARDLSHRLFPVAQVELRSVGWNEAFGA